MYFSVRKLLRTLLNISPDETSFVKRGFHTGDPSTQKQLENSASTFVTGYHAALESTTNTLLAARLEEIDLDVRGFAYEGAGMGLALLDFFFPWQKRFLPFTHEYGNNHIYMLYVGWGWSLGRLPRKQIKTQAPYDPLLCWLAYDGYGFHEGYFAWKKTIIEQQQPHALPQGYARRAFDQGIGRSLWFVGGGDAAYITHLISLFPASRQPDLWSGIGLACAYAGGVPDSVLHDIFNTSAEFQTHVAQGVAFAVKARHRAGNLGAHTLRASEIFCSQPLEEIIQITDTSLDDLPFDQKEPAFELWRQRIQNSLKVPITHP